MNRDENTGKSDQMNKSHEIALGVLPTEIISAGETPALDTQTVVDKAVSRATRNKRQWDRKTLATACGAARPAVERDLRSQGKAFTTSDVKNKIRVHVQGYADKYGVALPPKVVLGKTALEAVAGDLCGAFSLSWSDFMPPQVKLAAKVAQEGNPKAQGWLKKYFSKGSPAQPAAAPAAAPTASLAVAKPAENTTSQAADTAGSDDSLGDWLYQLNPMYWLKSKQERTLIDKEKDAWTKNAKLQEKLAKRDLVLKQGEKAVEAQQAVAQAQARSAEIEAQLKSIETQLTGACGSGACGSGASSSGACGGIQEIMGAGDKKPNPFDADLADYDAEPVIKKVSKARELNKNNTEDLTAVAAKLKMNAPLSTDDTAKILIYLARNEKLHEIRKNIVSGEDYASNPSAAKIQKHVVLGAIKAMTPTEQQMMAQIVALAKTGNPNAVKALNALKAQGYAVTMGYAAPAVKISSKPLTLDEQKKLAQIIAMAKAGNPNAQKAIEVLKAQGQNIVVGSDLMGFGLSDAWKIATLPVRGALAATNWTAKKLGITKGGGGSSPESVRLGRMRAAANRRKAAEARARAADAQSEAEYRAAQTVAAAADAEADANEAEATAKEAAMLTAEAEFLPGQAPQADDGSTTSGMGANFVGAVAPVITPLPPTPDTPSVANLKKARRSLVAKKNPRAAKILAVSESDTPEGMKLRASMKLYKAAQNRKSQERKAVANMVAKAKKGDKQALADVQALKAAGIAVKAERSAGRRLAAVAAYRATTTKVKAAQKKMEIAASDKLIRASRRHQLAKVAKIERRSAAGDKRAQAIIKRQVAKAKAGDPGAKRAVAALALAKHVRTTTPNRREARNLKQAHRLVKRVSKGDKTALAQVRVYEAAAKHGNPNAKRAMKRVRTAAAVETAVKTGMFVLPAVVVTSEIAAAREKKLKAERERKIATAEKRLAAGRGTREEVMAAAKAASDGGDKAKSAELAAQAATLPSTGEELRRTAAVAAAAGAGNLATQQQVAQAQQAAAAGDPAGIATMGNLAAVKSLDQVSKGKDISPEMKQAVRDVDAAQNGDPAAIQKIATAQDAAKTGLPAAVKYAVLATGAVAVSRALADNPEAKEQWRQKAGLAPMSTENEDVKIARDLVTTSPMSSLPDEPLPPVRGLWGLVKASLQAAVLATRDPFANYREAVASKGRRALPAVSSAGSAMSPREQRILEGALKNKTITRDDFELLTSLETNPGETEKQLRGAGVKIVSFGQTTVRGEARRKAKKEEPSEIDALNDLMDPSVKAAIEARKVKPAVSMGDSDDRKAKMVSDTKTRLSAIKDAAAKGDKTAQVKWSNAQTNYKKLQDKASKGDAKAKTVASILADTNLFA